MAHKRALLPSIWRLLPRRNVVSRNPRRKSSSGISPASSPSSASCWQCPRHLAARWMRNRPGSEDCLPSRNTGTLVGIRSRYCAGRSVLTSSARLLALEIANVVAKLESRGVVTEADSQRYIALLGRLNITTDQATAAHALGDTLNLSRRYRLSGAADAVITAYAESGSSAQLPQFQRPPSQMAVPPISNRGMLLFWCEASRVAMPSKLLARGMAHSTRKPTRSRRRLAPLSSSSL